VTKKDKENRSCLDVGSLEEKLKIAEEALREIKTRTVWRLKTYNHFYVLATNELPWLLERVGELEAKLEYLDKACDRIENTDFSMLYHSARHELKDRDAEIARLRRAIERGPHSEYCDYSNGCTCYKAALEGTTSNQGGG
jgi:tetratricopeptide (TPR) repeat protein